MEVKGLFGEVIGSVKKAKREDERRNWYIIM